MSRSRATRPHGRGARPPHLEAKERPAMNGDKPADGGRPRPGSPWREGRRVFLKRSGLAVGGLGALASAPGLARGQNPVDPHEDPNEFCNPWPPPPPIPVVFNPETSLPVRQRKSAFELTDA